MNSLIATVGLTKKLVGAIPVTLVQNVDLRVEPGEFLVIAGPSGCGKSSLLYLLGLLDAPTSGDVRLLGESTFGLSERKLADLRLQAIGFVFQFHFLLPEFTALENVLLPMERLGRIKATGARKRALEILDSLGMGDFADKYPQQLSGGQSQRVAIARALANEPKIILADEPTGSLDSAASANVRQLLKQLAGGSADRCVVTVTHDPSFQNIADRVVHMIDGSLVD